MTIDLQITIQDIDIESVKESWKYIINKSVVIRENKFRKDIIFV